MSPKAPSEWLIQLNRRNSGDPPKDRPSKLRRTLNLDQEAPEPHRTSRAQPNPPLSHVSPESRLEQPSAEDDLRMIEDTPPWLGSPEYSEDSTGLLQTPPDSAKDDFLFESHSIYHTQNASLDPANRRPLNLHSPNGPSGGGSLPAYIKPLPPSISDKDLDYLANKGALSLPSDELRNSLLRGFIDFVHPYMPILSLSHTIKAIEQGSGEYGTVSLLLFQAMMFTGAAFADHSCLRKGGFETRKEARRVLFHRARLLYDFSCEQDNITLIQAFLLLSYWFETPNDEKNTWHWLALAISSCHVAGLHRNHEKLANRHQLKRIWWSCLMRDTLVSLATKSPSLIKLEDCDVPMLTMDDFEILDTSGNIACVKGCSFLSKDEIQRHLALMLIEKAKLCVALGPLLKIPNQPKEFEQFHDTPRNIRARMMLLAPGNYSQTLISQKDTDILATWAANLPDETIYRRLTGEQVNKSLTIHAALLQMLYFATTIYAIDRSSDASQNYEATSSQISFGSTEKVRLAAMEITQIAQDLHELNLIRYLPTSGVTPVIMAGIIHLQCIKAGRWSIRKSSATAFHQCTQIMQELRENYFSADVAFSLMSRAVRKMHVGNAKHPSLQVKQQEIGEANLQTEIVIQAENRSDDCTEASGAKIPRSDILRQSNRPPSPFLPTNILSPPGPNAFFDGGDVSHFYQHDMMIEDLMDPENLNCIFGSDQLSKSFMQL